MRLVGHKGADLIVRGNTVESFKAAVDAGADTIELDVIWVRDADLPLEQRRMLQTYFQMWTQSFFLPSED